VRGGLARRAHVFDGEAEACGLALDVGDVVGVADVGGVTVGVLAAVLGCGGAYVT
jgi:hypothetical protein